MLSEFESTILGQNRLISGEKRVEHYFEEAKAIWAEKGAFVALFFQNTVKPLHAVPAHHSHMAILFGILIRTKFVHGSGNFFSKIFIDFIKFLKIFKNL